MRILLVLILIMAATATATTSFNEIKKVVVMGSTGQVGRNVVRQLLKASGETTVISLARRKVSDLLRQEDAAREAENQQSELVEQELDFSKLLEPENVSFDDTDQGRESRANVFDGADAVVCALGTTIKVAGSKERFLQIDHDYVLAAARDAREAGVGRLSYVSSMGADTGSSFYYSQVKGQVEADLQALGFERLSIFRPALLITKSREDSRPGEAIAQAVAPAFNWLMPANYKTIKVETVASGIVTDLFADRSGETDPSTTRIFLSGDIHQLAGQ
jgi:uncharacterized protein YbjT (DUF2867 family)